jgi:Protein of unknown function (DUF4242)
MPKYIVERVVPEVGDLPLEKLDQLGELGRTALTHFGGRVQWLESFITQNKIYSILTAPDEATIREYAKLTNLPTDGIHLIKLVADITTGEQLEPRVERGRKAVAKRASAELPGNP